VKIRGSAGSVVQLADDFEGAAAFVAAEVRGIEFSGFTIGGNRQRLEKRQDLPPSDVPFVRFTRANGILVDRASDVRVDNVAFRNIAGFAILAARSERILIDRIHVRDSGSRNARGRNNTTGGVLLEEGCMRFEVRNSRFERILGNSVWTHSLYTSPRNEHGVIRNNTFREIGRDAIQIGHATAMHVEANRGERIGYPAEAVDLEAQAIPVAIDTAGNVDRSRYIANRFDEINGKCIDLDGFHHGEVRRNVCRNQGPATAYPAGGYAIVMNNTNPDMNSEEIVIAENLIDGAKFGGIFVIGRGNRVEGNQLTNLNIAGCNESATKFGCIYLADEPELLQSGIYLGRRAERPAPATGNIIRGNRISGHRMASRCVASAPGVSGKLIAANRCADSPIR